MISLDERIEQVQIALVLNPDNEELRELLQELIEKKGKENDIQSNIKQR